MSHSRTDLPKTATYSFALRVALCALLGVAFSSGCIGDDDGAPGALHVLLEAESTITQGLGAGEEIEQIRDGWSVHYDQYLIRIGDIRLNLAREPSTHARAKTSFIVDLTRVGEDGTTLWSLDNLAPGRWSFGYRVGEQANTRRHGSVSAADFARMQDQALSYAIEGSLEKLHGVSCPPSGQAKASGRAVVSHNRAGDPCYDNPLIHISIPAAAETGFGPCEIEGQPGVSIPAGASNTVAATIHGDHLFFNGFPTGDEGGIVRLAQWLADCDLDLDGAITAAELQSIALADLVEVDERFQLGSAPRQIATVWDLVIGQLQTQGHLDGEGECEIEP